MRAPIEHDIGLYHRLFECLDSGELRWRARGLDTIKSKQGVNAWNAKYAGELAGTIDERGYVRVSVRKRLLYAHQVAWVLRNGPIPPGMVIDHINHDRADNSAANLRLVSPRTNGHNMRLKSNNTSGVCGVTRAHRKGAWSATITIDRRSIHLGSFSSIEEAASARAVANKKYGFHENHGMPL